MRVPDGVWLGKSRPQYRGVSAAWIFSDLSMTSITSRKYKLYINPWASMPTPSSLRVYKHTYLEGNKLVKNDGLSLGEIYGLNEGWPVNV